MRFVFEWDVLEDHCITTRNAVMLYHKHPQSFTCSRVLFYTIFDRHCLTSHHSYTRVNRGDEEIFGLFICSCNWTTWYYHISRSLDRHLVESNGKCGLQMSDQNGTDSNKAIEHFAEGINDYHKSVTLYLPMWTSNLALNRQTKLLRAPYNELGHIHNHVVPIISDLSSSGYSKHGCTAFRRGMHFLKIVN